MIAGHGLWTKVVPATRLPHIQKYPGFLFQCRIKSLQGRGGGRAESLDISLVEVLWWPLGGHLGGTSKLLAYLRHGIYTECTLA